MSRIINSVEVAQLMNKPFRDLSLNESVFVLSKHVFKLQKDVKDLTDAMKKRQKK